MNELERCLMPTAMIDCEDEAVQEKAHSLIEGQQAAEEKAKSLFYYVRDRVRYNPHVAFFPLRASATLKRRHGFCIQKAVLLAALARAGGIPARVGFACIRNHLTPEWIISLQKSNLFTHHGYAELYINGEWIKAKGEEIDVVNPAKMETIAKVGMSTVDDVDAAVQAAKEAYPDWRSTPAVSRTRYLYRLKELLEENFEELSRVQTQEHGALGRVSSR